MVSWKEKKPKFRTLLIKNRVSQREYVKPYTGTLFSNAYINKDEGIFLFCGCKRDIGFIPDGGIKAKSGCSLYFDDEKFLFI